LLNRDTDLNSIFVEDPENTYKPSTYFGLQSNLRQSFSPHNDNKIGHEDQALIKIKLPTSSQKTIITKAGFTLVELLVALGVFALLLTVAIPSFKTMLMNSRISSNSDALLNALNYARNTALTQAVNVRVCPLGALNSTTCGANWNNGWTIVTQPTTGLGAVLQSKAFTSGDPTITSSAATVTFDPHGLATTQSNFALCDSRGSTYARSVQVMATGYVQSGQTPGIAVWNNGAITCP